jgi:anti-sigma factor RsiW
MNPDKLFDYLDGNLPEYEREQVEQQLAVDSQLQRQLAMAREIHKGMRKHQSREVLIAPEDFEEQRAGRIGRRVATAFIVLVMVNVFIGIAFIIGKHRPAKPPNPEVRQQITESLQKAAADAMPPPTLADEIVMSASAAERDALADKVVAAAAQVGGSAAKALPNEHTSTVIVEMPASRENDFRMALVPLGAVPPPLETQSSPAPDGPANKLLQVQINERQPTPAHPQASP